MCKRQESGKVARSRHIYPNALPRNPATVLKSESCSDHVRRSTSHVGRASHVMRLWSTFARRGLRTSTESVGAQREASRNTNAIQANEDAEPDDDDFGRMLPDLFND